MADQRETLKEEVPRKSLESHGRGGFGNIGRDTRQYHDAGIHVEETPGSDGSFHVGRGGIGNTGHKLEHSTSSDRRDRTPDDSIRAAPAVGEGYSTGRGGAANIRPSSKKSPEESRAASGGGGNAADDGEVSKQSLSHIGLADKLKSAIFGGGHKK